MQLARALLLLLATSVAGALGGRGGEATRNVAQNALNAGPERTAPVHDLASVTSTNFTTLIHPAFPEYSVRIKQSKFCDGTVRWVLGAF